METYDQQRERQRAAAAQRVAQRTPERRDHEAALARPGGIAAADSPERIAKRLDRLTRYYAGEAPPRGNGTASEVLVQEALGRAGELLGADGDAGRLLEKIINTPDFVGIRYLDAGVAAARAVGRVNIRDAGGRLQGYGTGSLVSRSLLLTNHHVLPGADVARSSVIEFNYQDGIDGNPLQPQVLPLDPDRFYLADEERDFALVAVRATAAELAPFGCNRLIDAEGKAIIGEFVTIVQHPGGEKKQVALRENKIVDIPELFLHYSADTKPGSSGSPVFNDQWEVVALHHASVPAPDHAELGGVVNEGIRVSRILAFIHDQPLSPAMRSLADELAAPGRVEVAAVAAPAAVTIGGSTISLPLEITLRLGDGNGNGGGGGAGAGVASAEPEAVSIDPDYSNRRGYDAAFLAVELPLPVAADALAAVASDELRYHHSSIAVHRERRLALFTAVNIDGKQTRRLKRERDRWFFDPRLPQDEQTGEDVYRGNDLDRGHLVRRLDPAWGPSDALAKVANDDTFHFTNATPQHHLFNAGDTLWAGLEDYVLENADNAGLAVSVFTGPVLDDSDDVYRGVKLPRQFWKIVAMVTKDGTLSVTGYLLSQAALLHDLVTPEEFSYGAYRTFQVPVRRIAELTSLSLDPHIAADPLERHEATTLPRELLRAQDLVL